MIERMISLIHKIVHLGDLHLGIKFHKRNLISDQQYVLEQIIEQVNAQKANTVIAGDIFDTVNPPVEAQLVWFKFLSDLGKANRENGTFTAIVPGNHDSAARLSLASDFMEPSRIYVATYDRLFRIISANSDFQLVCVPFTKPAAVEQALKYKTDSYDEAYKEVLDLIGAPDPNTLLVAHQTFEGGEFGASEFKPFMSDAISLSTVAQFPAVLAGHIHAKQTLGNVHYCGSLLPYAFGDKYEPKVTLWTLDTETTKGWERSYFDIELRHPLITVEGDLAHCLSIPDEACIDCYVKVKLVNCLHFDEALAQLQDHFPLLCSVQTDNVDTWEADLKKPVAVFLNLGEALNAYCDFLEVGRFYGKQAKIIQEAIDAYSKIEDC